MKKSISVIALAALLFAISCGGEKKDESKHGNMMSHGSPTTKIIKKDGYQIIFDVSDMDSHMKMMKMMNMEMKMDHGNSHVLSLTVNDDAGNQVKEADVTLTVKDPAGKEIGTPAMVMSGDGMHHWVAGFSKGDAGDYTVSTVIKAGEKELTAEEKVSIQ